MHIPTFKMPSIRQGQHLIQEGDYASSIDLKDVYLHISIVKYHCYYQRKVLSFGLSSGPKVFTSLTKPMLFLCYSLAC